MISPQTRLDEFGIVLPAPVPAVGNYLAAKTHGDLVFVAGHGPLALDRLPGEPGDPFTLQDGMGAVVQGRVGADFTLEEAREHARVVGLFILSTLRAQLGSLDRVRSILKVVGMVNCAPGFTNPAGVVDGCSDLFVAVFGDEVGRHARSVAGMAELQFGVPVIIEAVVAVDP